MRQALRRKENGTQVSAWLACLLLGASLAPGLAADTKTAARKTSPTAAKEETPALNPADTKKQLLELTGGKRVKVVWNQETSPTDSKMKVRLFDTRKGEVVDLPFPEAGSAPLLTMDGRLVVISLGKAPADRKVMSYDTETGKISEICKGPGNNVLALWRDPKTQRDWVFVNDMGDKNQQWNQAAGPVYRFPIDKPAERVLHWNRTSSQIYMSLSADGTRACFNPTWGHIGQLKFAYDAEGRVDQDKSIFKEFGGGCWPSMAPDNSYRLFRLDGNHQSITLHDADNTAKRTIKMNEMLTGRQQGMACWLTRWSTHPRYMTCHAPNKVKEARIWIGRFDEGFTKIEKWVRIVTADDAHCWQSHAWVEPDAAPEAAKK